MDTKSIKNTIKEKSIIALMILSVFVGIYLALDSWLAMRNQEWLSHLTEDRITHTENLATDSDSQYFLISKIIPLLRIICEDSKNSIEATRKLFLSKYSLDLVIYKFDKSGELIEMAPKSAPNQWLMKNLFPALVEKDLNKISKNRKDLDKKVEFTFGYGKDLISIKNNPESIIKTVVSNKESFVAWSNREKNGVIILGNSLPDKEKVLSATLDKMPKLKNQFYAGRLSDKHDSEEKTLAAKAYKHLNDRSLEHGNFGGIEWYFTKTKSQELYYTAYKISTSAYYRGFLFLKVLFMILIPLTLLVVINMSKSSVLSLKKLVILIFLSSSLLPITLMGSTSLENIDAIININKNELRSSMEEAISNIIQNFKTYLTSCSNKLNEITKVVDGKIKDLKSIEEQIANIFPNARFSARDSASNLIYSNAPDFSSGQEALFKSIYHRYIERYMPERLNEKKYYGNEFSDLLIRKDDMGFSSMCGYPNKLITIRNGGIPMLFYVRVLPKEVGEVAIIESQPSLSQATREYTKNIDLRTLVKNQQQIYFTAFSPLEFKWIIPPPQDFAGKFLEQAKSAYVLDKPLFKKITSSGKEIYSICTPNSDMNEVCYICFLSTDEFQKEIKRQKIYITLGAIIAVILLLCIITWLMTQLIAPLGNLEQGILALAQRKFETKLPIPPGNDEFVTLFKEFNFMMGESYDMQTAKNVQESLITTKFPELEGYVISGISTPVNELGGDCLTSFIMPDGKLLFLIGVLAGHNIGSALMMAFVRSITFNWGQKNNNDPASLVEAIDQTLRDNQMKNMSMGIICGIMDPTNGKMNFVTKDHIYPIFLRRDGSLEWLRKPSSPPGIGKKRNIEQQETILFPGERLLCVSDGILTADKKTGFAIGYKDIEDLAANTLRGEDKTWLHRIKDRLSELYKLNKSSQSDDITLFTIISQKSYEGGQNAI